MDRPESGATGRTLTCLALVVGLLCAVPAAAQHLAHGASGLPHGIPDFCALTTDRLVIPANTESIIPSGTNVECIGVHGVATVPSGARVDFDNFLVYSGGALFVEAGAELVFRGNPLDLTADPEQFGEGFIALGDVTFRGVVNGQATIRIRSANPAGVRGHLLISGRGFAQIEGTITEDLGRTSADRSLNSATWVGDVGTPGTNQIGRYGGWHLHHLMGPLPGSGKPYQFIVRNNRMVRGGKWGGVVAHNSHFGLIEGNRCTEATICYVEEEGSETANWWIGNYAGQAVGAVCDAGAYDPEARCPAGFWLRGQNHVVKNNTVEDMQRGIGWWILCLEMSGPPCGGDVRITIPKFPGADTMDPTQIKICQGGDGSPTPCVVSHSVGMEVSGNTVRRADVGFDFWWTPRLQRGGPLITNTVTEDVKVPVFLHYTDAAFDGLRATGCSTLVLQFNDAHPIGLGAAESIMRHVDATCTDGIYLRVGQLHQAPLWRWEDSRLDAPKGIEITGGGQRVVGYPHATVTLKNLVMPRGTVKLATSTRGGDDTLPEQTITVTATNVNGQNFTLIWPEGTTSGVPPLPPTNVRISARE